MAASLRSPVMCTVLLLALASLSATVCRRRRMQHPEKGHHRLNVLNLASTCPTLFAFWLLPESLAEYLGFPLCPPGTCLGQGAERMQLHLKLRGGASMHGLMNVSKAREGSSEGREEGGGLEGSGVAREGPEMIANWQKRTTQLCQAKGCSKYAYLHAEQVQAGLVLFFKNRYLCVQSHTHTHTHKHC
jgi:hypothetical protein